MGIQLEVVLATAVTVAGAPQVYLFCLVYFFFTQYVWEAILLLCVVLPVALCSLSLCMGHNVFTWISLHIRNRSPPLLPRTYTARHCIFIL